MKVVFQSHQVFGNRSYKKGEHIVPDSLAQNLAFKQLVSSGAARVIPRDQIAQKVLLSRDVKAAEKARAARHAIKASKSAQSASSASHFKSSAAEASQPLFEPAKPISAEVEILPATALLEGEVE